MRILGIDPGSQVTGYGVVDSGGDRLVHVAHGTLRPSRGASLSHRLVAIQRSLEEVIQFHEPEVAVVERVFLAASPKAALILGHVRGVVLAVACASGLTLVEYAAREIKKAVVGTGAADKRQVQAMVRRLLDLSKAPAQDAADALAAAICHGHAGPLASLELRTRTRVRRGRRASASWVVRRAR